MKSINFKQVITALAGYVFVKLYLTKEGQNTSNYTIIIKWTQKFVEQFNNRLETNGKKGTLTRYKSIYGWTKGYLFETHNCDLLLDSFIRRDKKGFPSELSMISHLLDSESPGLRVIMTVLRLFESIKLPVEFDEEPITKEYSGKPLAPITEDFKSFCRKGLEKYGKVARSLVNITKLNSANLSFRLKGGPMGPSILTAHLDAIAIKNDSSHLKTFGDYCQITESRSVIRMGEQSIDMCKTIDQSKASKLRLGKISLSAEAAGKTRLFAICNFGVQSLLKPLHGQLMLVLRTFKSDGTYDQVQQYDRLRIKSAGRKVYCFDLSKATDRFPLSLQQALLGVIVSDDFSEKGSRLIASYPFSYKDKTYIWKVGQPLGALSSGAMFALTHHMVVQFCYYKSHNNVKWFSDYSLLGDDIGIWNSKVAEEYLSFMNSIGVEINMQKSVIGISRGEFAKRLFKDGKNIAGFGYQMVARSYESTSGGTRFAEILEIEGFNSVGTPLVVPVPDDGLGLPKSVRAQLNGMGALRNAFAQNLIISDGNICYSHNDIMEQYVLLRIELLYKQISSSLAEAQYIRLKDRIQALSKCGGLAVEEHRLDICFVNDELVSHPVVRYINDRNNLIFDKIEVYNETVQSSLFSQSDILTLSSYTEEEYIPRLCLDVFFSRDLNEIKFKLRTSIQYKAFSKLVKPIKA